MRAITKSLLTIILSISLIAGILTCLVFIQNYEPTNQLITYSNTKLVENTTESLPPLVEEIYVRVGKILGLKQLPPPPKVVFVNKGIFERPGFYHNGIIELSKDIKIDQNEIGTFYIPLLAHEITHHIQYSFCKEKFSDPSIRWYIEGLATGIEIIFREIRDNTTLFEDPSYLRDSFTAFFTESPETPLKDIGGKSAYGAGILFYVDLKYYNGSIARTLLEACEFNPKIVEKLENEFYRFITNHPEYLPSILYYPRVPEKVSEIGDGRIIFTKYWMGSDISVITTTIGNYTLIYKPININNIPATFNSFELPSHRPPKL
ncbi:hypothetical protein DRN63_00515 [Nanoarchaeota archaeon]|nr:MAG: hypothetical protein DRN63_00515 [Nanoarchaeota archaeon]